MDLSFTLKKTSLGKHSLIELLMLDLKKAARVDVEYKLFKVRGKIGMVDVIESYLLKLIFDVTFNKILLTSVHPLSPFPQ